MVLHLRYYPIPQCPTLVDTHSYIEYILGSRSGEAYKEALEVLGPDGAARSNEQVVEYIRDFRQIESAFLDHMGRTEALFAKYPPGSPLYFLLLELTSKAGISLHRVWVETTVTCLNEDGNFWASRLCSDSVKAPSEVVDPFTDRLYITSLKYGSERLNIAQRAHIIKHILGGYKGKIRYSGDPSTSVISTTYDIFCTLWQCCYVLQNNLASEICITTVHRPPAVIDVSRMFREYPATNSQESKAARRGRSAREILVPRSVKAIREGTIIVTKESMGICWPSYCFRPELQWQGRWMDHSIFDMPNPAKPRVPLNVVNKCVQDAKNGLKKSGHSLRFVGQREENGRLKMFIFDPFSDNFDEVFKPRMTPVYQHYASRRNRAPKYAVFSIATEIEAVNIPALEQIDDTASVTANGKEGFVPCIIL